MFNIMSHIANQSKYTRHYYPRHLLAQYAINQIATLELRSQDIVKAMGYPIKHTIPACERLRHVLSNKYLGLDGSYLDKYFTADEFLVALFTVLEIPHVPFAEDIAQIKDDLTHYPSQLPKYRLRAEIDFEFTESANWISRSAASRLANIQLPDEFAKLNESERASIVKKSIAKHHQQYEGNLPYDGLIKSYQLITERHNEVIDSVKYGLPKSKAC